MASVQERTAYARQAAIREGVDPNVFIRGLQHEGLQEGVWQSNASKNGIREPSYGPGQLLVGGPGTGYPAGLGNEFLAETGKHPNDPNLWKENIDFTLKKAKQDGSWRKWYGFAKAGIGDNEGFNMGPQLNPDPDMLTPMSQAMMDPNAGQSIAGPNGPMGLMGPGTGADTTTTPQSAMQLAMMQENAMANQAGLPGADTPMLQGMALDASQAQQPSRVPLPRSPGGGAMTVGTPPVPGPAPEEEGLFTRNNIKRGFLGAGAGLSSITNPAGAAVAAKMLSDMDGEGLSAYQAARLAQMQQKMDQDEGKEKDKWYNKAAAQGGYKLAQEMEEQNGEMRMQLGQLNNMEAALSVDGVYKGPAGTNITWLKSLGSILDPTNEALNKAASAGEAMIALQNQTALGLRSPKGIFGGLTGNTSDRDLRFLLGGVPGVDKIDGANKLIIKHMRMIYERKLAYNQEAARYIAENKSGHNLPQHMSKWYKEQGDIFKDEPGYGDTEKAAPKVDDPLNLFD